MSWPPEHKPSALSTDLQEFMESNAMHLTELKFFDEDGIPTDACSAHIRWAGPKPRPLDHLVVQEVFGKVRISSQNFSNFVPAYF